MLESILELKFEVEVSVPQGGSLGPQEYSVHSVGLSHAIIISSDCNHAAILFVFSLQGRGVKLSVQGAEEFTACVINYGGFKFV